MPLNAQTAKFVARRKSASTTPSRRRPAERTGQRRVSMPANAGIVIAAKTDERDAPVVARQRHVAQHHGGKRHDHRQRRDAQHAAGEQRAGRERPGSPAACGSRRAATSKPIRNATRSKSIHRSARVLFGCISSRSCMRSLRQFIAQSAQISTGFRAHSWAQIARFRPIRK